MLYLIIYFAVFVVWIGVELLIAPKGYEDENGFHLGVPDNSKKIFKPEIRQYSGMGLFN